MVPPIRIPPRFTYNGLTIIVSNPSRFDRKMLLSANGGAFFNDECLSPATNRYCCDIRLLDCKDKLMPETKAILVLGQKALSRYTGSPFSLSEQRGYPLFVNNIPCIASYLPQDACDIKPYEKKYNPTAEGFEGEEEEEVVEKFQFLGDKSRSRTSRTNWRFWLKQDTQKVLKILDFGIPKPSFKPEYKLYPNSEEVIEVLVNNKGKHLYIDIETDIEFLNMKCFAFCFDHGPVYVVPTLDWHYKPAYDNLPFILRALAIAFRDNTVVAHNGSDFDFLIFAHKYRIPIGRSVYDTLVAQARIFPEVEKSLGHCVSLWTYEPYHKAEVSHSSYYTQSDAEKLWLYCGKDVYTMVLVHEAQLKYARTMPGMLGSIRQAMESIRPYLIMTLLGIHFDDEERLHLIKYNDRLMMQYLRIIEIMTGKDVGALISNKRCCRYFHDLLGYPAVARSKKTGKPSFNEYSLLKLKLKHANPVIDVLIRYRRTQKETSTLQFEIWKPSGSSSTQVA